MMPSRTKRVRFETEYNSSFKAFDSDIYQSPLITALIDEPRSELPAGLKSSKFLKSVEPPLQTKTKVGPRKNRGLDNVSSHENGNFDAKSDSENRRGNKPKRHRELEYKAGLKPDNSLVKAKFPVSEYQREYEWKKFGMDDSPLLNAEKIVFDSHTNIPRFVRDKIPRKTEYQSKFTETKRVAQREKKEDKGENNGENKESDDDNPSTAVKRLLQTSHNPDPPFFPHGTANRVIHTEYQANFGSPKKYQYEEGIWLGVKPPHLLPDNKSDAGSGENITNWFEEVLELREKARHYKIRAIEGNYFSREFLAQLDAELEQFYEDKSKSSRRKMKSEIDDEISPSHSKRRGAGNENASQEKQRRPPVKHAWGSGESNENIEDVRNVYRDLNEQFKDVSLDSDTSSSHFEHDSVHDSCDNEKNKSSFKQSLKKTVQQKYPQKHLRHDNLPDKNENKTKKSTGQTVKQKHWNETAKREMPDLPDVSGSTCNSQNSSKGSETRTKNKTKPSFSNTIYQKPSSAFHRTIKHDTRDNALLPYISSGSDASAEMSEESGTESKESNCKSPDVFNIKNVKDMHSNDYEAPSTSVRSNYDSESLNKNSYDSDSYLSQSSFATQESVARQTLAHAKQRKKNFWQ